MGSSRLARVSLAGKVLAGRYEVMSLIGEGALGAVWKAKQRMVERIVAIKVLSESTEEQSAAFLRFQREAQALSSLNHPNIVMVFDFGLSEEGFPFLVMDYLQGQNLHQLIQQEGRMEVDRAVPIFIQICNAMAHAHSRGILHRDLKPDNIILTENDGTRDIVKLVDFGIAKRLDEDRQNVRKLTVEGQVLGTPAFMSPEQIMGNKLDARSDIYSFGCLMFYSLTGVLPISGSSSIDTMAKHISNEPMDFATAAPGIVIPQGLQRCIKKALKKFPEERQQTMAQMREELEWHA